MKPIKLITTAIASLLGLAIVAPAAFAGSIGAPAVLQNPTPAVVNQNVDGCLFLSAVLTFVSGHPTANTRAQANQVSATCSIASAFFAEETPLWPANVSTNAQQAIAAFDELAITDSQDANTNAWRTANEQSITTAKTLVGDIDSVLPTPVFQP